MNKLSSALSLLAVALAAPVGAQQDGPAAVVRSAERAVHDDSVHTVTTRWRAAFRRDSTDRAAALGLATVARATYDFETAEHLLGDRAAGASGTTWGAS